MALDPTPAECPQHKRRRGLPVADAVPAGFIPYADDLKAHWGVRALHDCVFSPPQGVLELPRTSDCTIAIVPDGLGSTRCDAPSPVLAIAELRGLVFQLERPT